MEKRTRPKGKDLRGWNAADAGLYVGELLLDYNLSWAVVIGLFIRLGWMTEGMLMVAGWGLYLVAGMYGSVNVSELTSRVREVAPHLFMRYLIVPSVTFVVAKWLLTPQYASAILLFQLSPIGVSSSIHFSLEVHSDAASSVLGTTIGMLLGTGLVFMISTEVNQPSILAASGHVLVPLGIGVVCNVLSKKNKNQPGLMEKYTELPFTSTVSTVQLVLGVVFLMTEIGSLKNIKMRDCIIGLLVYGFSVLSSVATSRMSNSKCTNLVSMTYLAASPPELIFLPLLVQLLEPGDLRILFSTLVLLFYSVSSFTSFWVFSWLSTARIQKQLPDSPLSLSPATESVFSSSPDVSQRNRSVNASEIV